ncbi:MAG: non-homologous end-joining DNA ligase [Opitutales bacterium]
MKAKDLEISHPDKVLFPESGLSKQDVADYYGKIGDHILPGLRRRPLTFKVYPGGIAEDGFFNKNAPGHFPDFIERIEVPTRSKEAATTLMATARQTDDLVYFAGQNIIEIHAGLSTSDDLEKPDQVIFDLDPSDDAFEKVRDLALGFGEMLESIELSSFLKTTGSRGLHIHIPLQAEAPFAEVKSHAKFLSEKLVERFPKLATLETRKNKRGDKVFVDYLRNEFGQTAIAPFSLRARESAPVATPLRWDELSAQKLSPQEYNIKNIFRRLSKIKNPWGDFNRSRVTPGSLAKKLGAL